MCRGSVGTQLDVCVWYCQTRRYEDDIEFFCEALDEELAANDNIMEEEQLERVLALLTTEEV